MSRRNSLPTTRERQKSFDADPLITRAISVNILLGLYEAAERVVADAQAITVPTQLLISGADWVVHHQPQHDFFERLGCAVKEKHLLEGFYHDTLGEANREGALTKVRDFILQRFAEPLSTVDLRDADKHGPVYDEAIALAKPLPRLSPKGLYWALARLNMKLGGYLSAGVRLGHETGFDSGSTLDYVYRNAPTGCGPLGVGLGGLLGRFIDRQYLESIGWRGIRQRKVHLEELLHKACAAVRTAGQSVHILDIAAGHGRYVLEAIVREREKPASILLRDFSDTNVQDGVRLIEEKGLGAVARFERGDAFDRESVANVRPRPTIGIVSGLYELFPDNAAVACSLAGMADAMERDAYLLYTGQPWHPQLELIARALTSHRGGQAWVMRRRSQGEMDQLVAEAGFEKIDQRIDEMGIFTVSLARRKAR